MRGLADQVVVITGGTSGIGEACVRRFLDAGARVTFSGRRHGVGERQARELGGRAVFVGADVTCEADLKRLIDGVIQREGRIDCVISNAGAPSRTTSIPASAPADFDHDIALHVRAAFLAMKYAAPSMIARGAGSFINMSSISGRAAGFNTFGYEVAKAALVHLTRCAALEFGEHGVRVNAISPGPTLTEIFVKTPGGDAPDTLQPALQRMEAAFEERLPTIQALRGMIQADDIASAALFLASDDARYITGHDLVVDGGICAGRPVATMRADWRALSNAREACEA